MLRGGDMDGARDLCERVLAGPAVPCCTDENGSGNAGNRWEGAKTAGNGVAGVGGGVIVVEKHGTGVYRLDACQTC